MEHKGHIGETFGVSGFAALIAGGGFYAEKFHALAYVLWASGVLLIVLAAAVWGLLGPTVRSIVRKTLIFQLRSPISLQVTVRSPLRPRRAIIMAAHYGVDDLTAENVTEKVRSLIAAGPFVVSNETLLEGRDPAVGTEKRLQIAFRMPWRRAAANTLYVPENQLFDMKVVEDVERRRRRGR